MAVATRWGIIGAGLISSDFVLALSTLPSSEHQVVAVGDRSLESAREFAAKRDIPRSYGSHGELLADDTVDIVYVGTIHPTHRDIVLQALDAGKPVLCEKPMTMSAAYTGELILKAREKKLFLMEATWMRFFPACVELRRLISDGRIGEVKFVRANFSFRRPTERSKGRLIDRSLGGGSVLDVGVYTVSFATMIFGGDRPTCVHASGTLLETGVDDLAVITLKYSGGRIAQLSCSISYSFECDAIVCGTKGELRLPHPFWCPTALETPLGVYEGGDSKGLHMDFLLPHLDLATNYPNSVGLCYEAEEVRQCLLRGDTESQIMSLDESLIVAEIADEILKQIGVNYEL